LLAEYAHLLMFLVFGLAFGGVTLFVLSPLFRTTSTDARQRTPYECGMEPVGTAFAPAEIRFYLFALLFVIFDVEVLFLIPWAVIFKELGWLGFVEMMGFIAVLMAGLVYAWRKGVMRSEN